MHSKDLKKERRRKAKPTNGSKRTGTEKKQASKHSDSFEIDLQRKIKIDSDDPEEKVVTTLAIKDLLVSDAVEAKS